MANSKIRQSAKDQECQVRLEMICNFNPETVVFAHLGGGGMARKHEDLFGSFTCSDCHSAVDGHTKTQFTRDELRIRHYEGIFRTQKILLDKGLIKI